MSLNKKGKELVQKTYKAYLDGMTMTEIRKKFKINKSTLNHWKFRLWGKDTTRQKSVVSVSVSTPDTMENQVQVESVLQEIQSDPFVANYNSCVQNALKTQDMGIKVVLSLLAIASALINKTILGDNELDKLTTRIRDNAKDLETASRYAERASKIFTHLNPSADGEMSERLVELLEENQAKILKLQSQVKNKQQYEA